MKISRKMLFGIGAIVIGALVVTGGIPLLLGVVVNTEGIGYEYRDVLGGATSNGGGDLLNAPAYVTSWTGGGNSELIAIQGHYKSAAGFFEFTPEFTRYWYKVTLTVDNPDVKINGVTGTTYTSSNYEYISLSRDFWTPCEALYLTLTNPCSGKVHVELWGHVNDLNPLSDDTGLLAVDEAYLRSGVGKVQCTDDVVEEGSYAKIYVETGYSHSSIPDVPDSDEGWTLQISNLDTGKVLFTKAMSDNYAGTVSWLVPDGTYSSTSTNKMKVILRNELLNQDDDDLFVVGSGMLDQIPEKPTFKIIAGDPPYAPGESITVEVSAVKNTYDIAGFWVSVSYETSAGTTTEYVINSKWFAATKTTTGGYCQVTFTFPSTGYVRMEASAADTMNLNSGNSELTWTVYDADGDTGTGDDLGPIDWTSIFMVVILVAGAMFIYWKAPFPPMIKWVLVLVLLAIAGYFMYGLIQSAEG